MLSIVRDMDIYDEGFAIGYEIGYKIGYEIGFAIGYEIGRKEYTHKIILKMLEHFSDFQINLATDTPMEEIAKIREEQNNM